MNSQKSRILGNVVGQNRSKNLLDQRVIVELRELGHHFGLQFVQIVLRVLERSELLQLFDHHSFELVVLGVHL